MTDADPTVPVIETFVNIVAVVLVVDVVADWLGLSEDVHLVVALVAMALVLAFVKVRVERGVR
ncbi:hypothetical protein C5B90_06335 [Haloferax sp. Atlit-12N]|uniref:hypothetical protein n=1 Tax=Haloferax sp. Atlit-12N TaxID=2077203 RepID=UPI000E22B52C|nr:hypothetical protein [Haloferax sp. Atlit-12N]RDZ65961.1 hypothetical protein C5B90_06335 [Haloferax sp. Atlit-12N]